MRLEPVEALIAAVGDEESQVRVALGALLVGARVLDDVGERTKGYQNGTQVGAVIAPNPLAMKR